MMGSMETEKEHTRHHSGGTAERDRKRQSTGFSGCHGTLSVVGTVIAREDPGESSWARV